MTTTERTPGIAAAQQLAHDWYAALDTHAPPATLVAMLDPTDLIMTFPEATLRGIDGFLGWYDAVTKLFFDEVHQVQDVVVRGERTGSLDIEVLVRWEASRWSPPAARSERIALLAHQSWVVSFDEQDRPRISRYVVNRLKYLPGSAHL